ncbi:13073_t:CDS:2, partial [Cetraspora pellucida]
MPQVSQVSQLRTEDGWEYIPGCECECCLEHINNFPQNLNQPNSINQYQALLFQHNFPNQQLNFRQLPTFNHHQPPSINQHQSLLQPIQHQPLLQPNFNNQNQSQLINEHPQIINNQSIEQVINVILQLKAIIKNNNNQHRVSPSQEPFANVSQNPLFPSQGPQANFNQNCADARVIIITQPPVSLLSHYYKENEQLIAELNNRNALIEEYALQMKKQHDKINRLGQICKYQNEELKINNLDNNMDLQLPKSLEKFTLRKV